MSRIPPLPPELPYDDSTEYIHSKIHPLALVSLILGVVAMPLVFLYGVGFVLGVIALIFGIIALVSINNNPRLYGGKGFAIAGISVGGGGMLLMGMLYLLLLHPSGFVNKERERSTRAYCAANLRGIMNSMIIYANENNDSFPYLGPTSMTAKTATDPSAPGGGLMHDMFYLVVNGQCGARQFLCRSDPANTAISSVPTTWAPKSYWQNPGGGDNNLCYSYSFAYPYAANETGVVKLAGFWENTCEAGLAIGADMNPGTRLPPGITTFNSYNHLNEGQNVGFADGHTEFSRTPACGENGDNIYNYGSKDGTAPGQSNQRAQPAGNKSGAYDTDLSPMLINGNVNSRQ